MNLRTSLLPITIVVCVMALPSLPARAGTPASGAVAHADSSLVVRVAKKKRETRQQELDRSIDNGTVPSRYRANVPRAYQQYIPFEKTR